MIAILIVAVLAIGGGVSVVAESAVPGDALYPVKVSVNEEVRGALAIGAEADALWEVELAERRLKEAKMLEVRGDLTVEAAADLNAEFNSHAEAAIEAAQTMQAEGKGEAAQGLTVALEAVTEAHADLFTRREGSSGQASGKRTFVLPHVLEKAGIRVSAGDVDGDGAADASAEGELGVTTDPDDDNDGAAEKKVNKIDSFTIKQSVKADGSADMGDGAAGADVTVELDAALKAGYDLGTNKKP